MGAVRSSRPALLLPRNGSLRAHHRSAATARVDLQGRIHPRPAAAGRGPYHYRRGRRSARAAPARSITPHHPHLLARATTPQRPLAPAQRHPPQTRRDRRDRGSRASSPPTAGRSPPGLPIQTTFRRHPCRRATPSHSQPPTPEAGTRPPLAADSPTHANPPDAPVAAGEAARASPAREAHAAGRHLRTRRRGRGLHPARNPFFRRPPCRTGAPGRRVGRLLPNHSASPLVVVPSARGGRRRYSRTCCRTLSRRASPSPVDLWSITVMHECADCDHARRVRVPRSPASEPP